MSKKEKTSSTQQTSQQQHLVTTPTNPEWVTAATQGLQGRINNLLTVDPQTLVPGVSALQGRAFDQAAGLGGGQPGNAAAQQTATGLLDSHIDPRQAVTPAGATASTAATTMATAAPEVKASLATASPQVQAMLANASPEVKAMFAQAASAVSPTLASSGTLLDTDLSKYQNLFEKSVIDTTLAANDEATGMRRAQLAAAQARGQKFSGSGSAIERAMFERGALQDRAGIEAQLRAQGYDAATAAAMADLNRSADTSRVNAGLSTSTALSEAQRADEMARTNAALGTSTALTEAQRADEMARHNADLSTSTGLTEAQRADEMARTNAALATSTGLTEAQRADAMARANAEQANTNSRTNAGLLTDTSKFNAGLLSDTDRFNVGQANDISLADRDAQLRAAGLLGDLSNSQGANERADIGLLSDQGDKQREIERERLGANTELLKLIAALNGSQPYNLFHGQSADGTSSGTSSGTSTSTVSDPFGAVGGLLQGVGSLGQGLGSMGVTFSDRRLKTGVERLGKDSAGRNLYEYRYRGEPKGVRRVGYMAQDIQRREPEAVIRGPGGYKMVDYGLLGEAA